MDFHSNEQVEVETKSPMLEKIEIEEKSESETKDNILEKTSNNIICMIDILRDILSSIGEVDGEEKNEPVNINTDQMVMLTESFIEKLYDTTENLQKFADTVQEQTSYRKSLTIEKLQEENLREAITHQTIWNNLSKNSYKDTT